MTLPTLTSPSSLQHWLFSSSSSFWTLRGGGATGGSGVAHWIQSSLLATTSTTALMGDVSGLLALWAVASAVVVPLTLYRTAYSFSVGYGLSVAAMGAVLVAVFSSSSAQTIMPARILAWATVAYGVRLAAFLVLRNATVQSKREQVKSFDKPDKARWTHLPLALSVSLLYSWMVSPVWFALRHAGNVQGSVASKIQMTGTAVALLGLLMETAADAHKYWIKRNHDAAKKFVGPTGGLYALSRHPNYLGEVLFWLGLYVGGGVPNFGSSAVAWSCASLGLWGIVAIMTGATKRLDQKQLERYQGQEAYDVWRAKVQGGLFPKLW